MNIAAKKSSSTSRKKWQKNDDSVPIVVSKVDIDSFSGYASNPSGLVNDSQLLVGGYSN
jgi:hypothetical protein